MIRDNDQTPILRCFLPLVYQVYTEEEYLDFLKWINPAIDPASIHFYKVEKKQQGRALYIQTSRETAEYIKQQNFVLPNALGTTFFDQRIILEAITYVTTKEPKQVNICPTRFEDIDVSFLTTAVNQTTIGSPHQYPPEVHFEFSREFEERPRITESNNAQETPSSSQAPYSHPIFDGDGF